MKGKIYFIVAIIVALAVAGILIFKPIANRSSSDSISEETNMDSLQTFYNRAAQYRLQNKVDSSISAYEEAIRLKPDDKTPFIIWGLCIEKNGNLKKPNKPGKN